MAGDAIILRDPADHAQALRQLLPSGPAWDFAADGPFDGLLLALAEEFARLDQRALDLLEEADPRTALETLLDWERVAGLPDACTGAPDNVTERRVALLQKLTGIGGQSKADFVALAALIGFEIEIEEHRPFQMGSRIGDPINGSDWNFVWTVRVYSGDGLFDLGGTISNFRMGSRMGDRLRGFGSLDLECTINRVAPAHTTVIFAYESEPEAAFWINFNQ